MAEELFYKEWLARWLAGKEGYVKEATYANYSVTIVNHIIPVLGDCTIPELTEGRIQGAVLAWLESGRLDNKGGLSEKTVRDFLMIIKLSRRAATKYLKLPHEPLEIKFPKTGRIEKLKVLLPAETQRLIQNVLLNLNSRNAGFLIALYAGVRIGELCALQWKDIDMEKGVLSITKTIQRVNIKRVDGESSTRIIISTPKTRASVRTIPLASCILPAMRRLQPEDNEVYLITGTRGYLEPRSYRSYYSRYLRRIGIPHLNFHGLRHTFASRLIEQGADVKTVSELLGHASVTITLNLYVHPQMEQKRKCIEMIHPFL